VPGGGGVPVVRDANGRLRGVEAVVDKDRTSAILASSVKADALLLLTDVAGVEVGYGTPDARTDRAAPAPPNSAGSIFPPGRWVRRSMPCASSLRRRAASPPSVLWPTPRPS
jgi:hypothetical protein